MSKGVVIFFILIIVGLGFAYYYFENPFSNGEELFEINIYTVDENNKQIKTGYMLYLDNELYSKANTSSEYIIREEVPFDKEVRIKTFNLEEQNYYSEEISFYSEELNKNKRAKLELRKPGDILINDTGLLHNSEKNEINISTNRLLRDVYVCIDWSFHFFYADIVNQTKTEDINEFENCYLVDEELENGEIKTFEFDYKIFGVPDSSDNIVFYFFDDRNKEKPIKTHKIFY